MIHIYDLTIICNKQYSKPDEKFYYQGVATCAIYDNGVNMDLRISLMCGDTIQDLRNSLRANLENIIGKPYWDSNKEFKYYKWLQECADKAKVIEVSFNDYWRRKAMKPFVENPTTEFNDEEL